MDFSRGHLSPNPASALQVPQPRRIATVAGQRLSAITCERPPSPSSTSALPPSPRVTSRWSDSTNMNSAMRRPSIDSQEPPAYAYHPPSRDKLVAIGPVVRKRGGCKRVAFVVLAAVLVIALGIGLGVGLTRGNNLSTSPATLPGSNAPPVSEYPLGEFSLVTALRDVSTNCTSNSNTWRCFPGQTFDQSPAASLTTFNWILSNTSASYATNNSGLSTSSQGVAANITISASDDPFSIVFAKTPLTFINDTSPRYTFVADVLQKMIPSSNITADNRATVCFFNQTQVVGTLHLDETFAQRYTYIENNASYPLWPHAVQVELISPGGTDTPACYYTNNGLVGERVNVALTSQPEQDTCLCGYRNYL